MLFRWHLRVGMKKSQWVLRALLSVAVIASLSCNGKLSVFYIGNSTLQENALEPGARDESLSGSAYISTTSNRPLLLGIACPLELQPAILRTYLNRDPSKHTFEKSCPYSSKSLVDNCTVHFEFFSEGVPIREWFADINALQVKNSSTNSKNPWVLWVTGPTLLYPPYWKQTLADLERRLGNHRRMIGETLPVSCDGINKRRIKITCTRLAGKALLTTYDTIVTSSSSCWNSPFWANTTGPPVIDQSRSCWNDAFQVTLPKQFHIPGSDVDKFDALWLKLLALNNLNATIDFVTAKFGRESEFKDQVLGAQDSLLRFGAPIQRIHAYYDFPDYIVNDKRWTRHLAFLDNVTLPPKGAGYWFWKAPLVLHHLHQTNWNDFVAFADADLGDHFKWMVHLVEDMLASNTTLALYQVEYSDHNYTKRDVWNALCPNHNPANDFSLQYAGGWVVVQKTPTTLQFIEQWQQMKSDFHLLSDDESRLPNLPGFQYHLHDQSMLSLLTKCQYSKAYQQRVVFDGATSLKDWSVHLFPI